MSLKNTFARGFVWKIAGLLAIALFSYIGIGKAHAQDYSGCNVHTNKYAATCPDRQQAWSTARGKADYYKSQPGYSNPVIKACGYQSGSDVTDKGVRWKVYDSTNFGCENGYQQFEGGLVYYMVECPAGKSWSDTTKTCIVMPTQEQCLAKNVDAKKPTVIVFQGHDCIDNCKYGALKVGTLTSVNPWTVTSGEMGFTGESCSVAPLVPANDPTKPPEQKCIPHGTLTMCIQPDGRHCYNSTTGRQICWAPGETGEKTDGPIKQTVAPGPNPPVPSPPNPGDTQSQVGNPSTTTINHDNRTITTTSVNTITGSGANAGPKNSGTPATGTGTTPAPDTGDDEGDKGTASGGAGCDTPPVFTGDQLLGNILLQTWRNRCSGNGNKTGSGGCGPDGGVIAFVCTGDEILCGINQRALEKKCGDEKKANDLADDAAEVPEPDGTFDPWGTGDGDPMSFDGNLLNMSAGTGQLFPEFDIEGVQIAMPQAIYDLIDIIKLIVIASFTLWAVMIAGGSNRS